MTQPRATGATTDGLSPKQVKALAALLEGQTVPQTATTAGVHRVTVWSWLKEPAFAAALRYAESIQLDEIARALGAAGAGAVATLVSLKDDAEVPAAVRARAASDLLSRLLPIRETIALEARIAAIEQALDGGEVPSHATPPRR